MSEVTPTATTQGVERAASDVAATVAAGGWDVVFDPATARDVLGRGTVPAHAGPAQLDALAALTTLEGAAHTLATATEPVAAATQVATRLVNERGVPPGLANWATAVVLEVVQPGWGSHYARVAPPVTQAAPPPPVGAPATAPVAEPARRSSRWVFPVVLGVVVLAAIAVALVFLLARGGDEKASDTTSPTAPASMPGTRSTPTSEPKDSNAHVDDLTVSGTATPGAPAPALTGPDVVTNQPLSLASMAGKPTLVVFWAHWCPHCQKEMPVIQQVADEQSAAFNFLTVATAIGVQPSQPDFSSPKRFMNTQGITMPTMRDGDDAAAAAFGVTSYPTMFMVDASGKLVGRATGELSAQQLLAFMQNPTFTN